MLKKIYICVIFVFLWIWWSNCSGLIQVTDGIFGTEEIDSKNSWSIVTKPISNTKPQIFTWTVWSTGNWIAKSGTWYLSWNKTNKILISNLGSGLSADIDFVQWINRMYENGLTNYNEVSTYRPYDKVTREEMAKIISKLYDTEWLNLNSWSDNCNFKDSKKFSSEMSPYIYKVCSLGIMKWSSDMFYPWKILTRAQWLAIMVRLFEKKNLDENQIPRYSNYYDRWLELGFLPSSMKITDMDIWLSRYRLAKFIYTYHIKNKFVWDNKSVDRKIYSNFIDILDDTIFATDDKSSIMKAHIKSNNLIINWWDALSILLDNKLKLKIVKITSTNKSEDKMSFVWYWDIYDNDYNLVWISTFIYSDNIIKEWYIRLNNNKTVYKILPSTDWWYIYDIDKKNYK